MPNCTATAVSYLTRDILLSIREHETEDFRFDRALTDAYIASLDPSVRLPVIEAFAHKQYDGPFKEVMRVQVVLPKHGQKTRNDEDLGIGIIDMPIEDYLRLPIA